MTSCVCDVRFFVIVLFICVLPVRCGEHKTRDQRKFGGYRITPSYCKATRASKFNRGSTICMFNHECAQRGGEVVGACMDGFLFGACCQLKSDTQSHFPKGPGVVMTSYLDYPEVDPEEEFQDESDELTAWHNSFKPVVTPGHRPSEKYHSTTKLPQEIRTTEQDLPETNPTSSTETLQAEIISEGLTQITNTLLNSPPQDSDIVYIRPGITDVNGVYSHSTITHNVAETYLLHKNGSEVDNIARPSDFNIQVSSMQTKPTVSPSTTTTSSTQRTVSTHRPVYNKPAFKPKPGYKPVNKTSLVTKSPQKKPTLTTEKYVAVQTITKEPTKTSSFTSLQSPVMSSIIQMLNETTASITKEESSTASIETTLKDSIETKSSPAPSTTASPVSYSSGYPNYYVSTGHYVTLKPSTAISHSNTIRVTSSIQPTYSLTTRPIYVNNKYSTSSNSIPEENRITTVSYITTERPYSSVRPPSHSTSQSAIDSFNKFTTSNDFNEENTVTTFSFVTSNISPSSPSTTTRRPPSTSYVFGSKPSRRPIVPTSTEPSYDIAPDNFASVTPTVIVLNGLQTPKPNIEISTEKEPQFVEISQEPFKKPISMVTINNNIESTNNIYLSKPPSNLNKPSSPTVVITPKPSPTTTSFTKKPSGTFVTTPGVHTSTIFLLNPSNYEGQTYTTFKPEFQTSPDDSINFPPVRNPLLNATGSNPSLYNTSVSQYENDLTLHDFDYTTPSFLKEDDQLKEKMNLFVNKIVGSLQGTFQELHDIVILDKKPNATILNPVTKTTTVKPNRKPTTRKPTTRRPPSKLTTTTRKPQRTTRKPVRLTTSVRRPTTTQPPSTTKKQATTTKKSKPITKVTTTGVPTSTELDESITTELYVDGGIDYNDKNLCGLRPLAKSGRVVGGKNAKFGDYPWQVLVRESTWLGLFTKNKCGGVLITNRFVTTAAHCQPGFLASLVAVFGENDISGDFEPKRPVSRNVRRVIVHRQYDAATFENDLALLELESPIKFDAHIVPICMPPDNADFTGRMATVTGWGRLKYGGGVPAVLQEVQVPVIENNVCQEMFQTAGHTKFILNSFLCAGYANGQKDSCEGDSGGPLVLQREDGHWQLVGTVSHGIKCASPYLPGVYMRTTYYKPWLKSITGVH